MSATANEQETPTGVVKASVPVGRFDRGEWKRSQRRGRERGCWVYIAAEQLAEMGIDPQALPPVYRVWGSTDRPRAVISLKVPQ